MITVRPADKRGRSLELPIFCLILLLASGGILFVSLEPASDHYVLLVTVPFLIFLLWLEGVFVSSFLNVTFSTTRIEIEKAELVVSNHPFGRSFVLPLTSIKSMSVTDVLGPTICWEVLLLTNENRTIQVCTFRQALQARELAEKIEELAGV